MADDAPEKAEFIPVKEEETETKTKRRKRSKCRTVCLVLLVIFLVLGAFVRLAIFGTRAVVF
jgi:cytoskeletal protein RodZ